MPDWSCALELDSQRQQVAGDAVTLAQSIRAGADLRVGTAFRHNQHIDTTSSCNELIREVMDFRVTYLVDDHWVAGIENLRMPISLPDGFGPRPSMSFFLYNQDGHQAIARPHLDGAPDQGELGPSAIDPHADMPKYHELANNDPTSNAPSSNFIYNFEYFRFFTHNVWQEVFAHDAQGRVESGSLDALTTAFAEGCEVKVAIKNLCSDLAAPDQTELDHEVFIHLGAGYYYTERKQFMASANPVVRTSATIPLGYHSQTWDFGWLMPRTDGHLARWLCNPYTLKFEKSATKKPMRWFVNK